MTEPVLKHGHMLLSSIFLTLSNLPKKVEKKRFYILFFAILNKIPFPVLIVLFKRQPDSTLSSLRCYLLAFWTCFHRSNLLFYHPSIFRAVCVLNLLLPKQSAIGVWSPKAVFHPFWTCFYRSFWYLDALSMRRRKPVLNLLSTKQSAIILASRSDSRVAFWTCFQRSNLLSNSKEHGTPVARFEPASNEAIC